MSLLSNVALAPADPILGISEQYRADPNPQKVNLGVGVYLDETGALPLFAAVAQAEAELAKMASPRGYLPIDGLAKYRSLVKELVFESKIDPDRVVTVQSLSGTGALKLGADFLAQVNPNATVWVSDPSWENHVALFGRAGFQTKRYHYYDAANHGVAFDQLLADLRTAQSGDIVVLHACCHNPTGYDLSHDQWQSVIQLCNEQGLVPFLDMAYQGFSQGLAEDSWVIKEFAKQVETFFVATSFAKIMGLYGERIGSLSVVCANGDEATKVHSQIKIVIRTNYSNPPTHGAAIVTMVLQDPQLRASWMSELDGMRNRIKQMRTELVAGLGAAGITGMDFIQRQVGMFSYSGLSKEQMISLRTEHSVYGLDSGRICVAGLNPGNLDYVISAISAVSG